MSEAALTIQGIRKTCEGNEILRGVSMTVEAGQITGLIGPNGAGKTTLLSIVAGLRRADSGLVLVEERPWTRKEMNNIGVLLDHPGLWPFLTGRENLTAHARLRGVELSDISRVLEIVSLTAHADKKVRKYSLGMRWRLGIAIALLGDPKIIILDEPTNGLDPAGIRDMRSLLRSIATKGHAVLVSSHQLHEVRKTCDQVAVLACGEIRYLGPLSGLAQGRDLEAAFFALVDR